MAEPVKTVEDYRVGTKDVFLSVEIGKGQTGTTEVLLGTKPIVTASGDIGGLFVGTGTEMVGKKLHVRSIINDVMSVHNEMSVQYQLRGGAKPQDFDAEGSVPTNGMPLRFRATFTFTE